VSFEYHADLPPVLLAVEGYAPLPAQKTSEKPKHPKTAAAPKPKGYISAFNFFSREIRPTIQARHASLSVSRVTCYSSRSRTHARTHARTRQKNEINKLVGVAWKKLSKEGRKTFEQRGNQDKLRYLEELQQYNIEHKDMAEVPR
jgi:hypothetical protein